MAQEISRLKSGITALSEVKKTAKGGPAPVLDAVNKLELSLNRNLERAIKENDRVYLHGVPPASSLPPLPAYSMVKPLPLGDVLDASKEKMFLSLVPDSSTKALSKYTEMLDDVIRTQAEKLQQGSELARVRLKEMDLPDSLLSLEGNSSLPENLKDVEAVQIGGGPAGLEAELQQLRDLRRVNQELLVQTEKLLQKETQEDVQFRSQFGSRWTRCQSSTLTKNLQDRLNRFAGNLKQARDSDARIERCVRDHSALMSILDRHPIEAALPTLAKPIMSLDSNEDAIVRALKQTLRHLETLGAQRAGLEDMLKEMKRKDDILPKLMTATVSYEDLFKKEISKYSHICEEIAQNLEAQERLLIQIQMPRVESKATSQVLVACKRTKQEKRTLYLPREMMFNILLLISAEVLYKVVRYVCKEWYNIVSDPVFARAHHQMSSGGLLIQAYDELHEVCYIEGDTTNTKVTEILLPFPGKILGSVHGFVLLHDFINPKVFHVMNLVTKVKISLPPLAGAMLDDLSGSTGFGINSWGHLKVVHVLHRPVLQVRMRIFTVGVDKAWRFIDLSGIPENERGRYSLVHRPYFIGGLFYWSTNASFSCVALNADTEVIYQFSCPEGAIRFVRVTAFLNMGTSLGFMGVDGRKWMLWKLADVESCKWTQMANINIEKVFRRVDKNYSTEDVVVAYPLALIDGELWCFRYIDQKDIVVRYNLANDNFAVFPLKKLDMSTLLHPHQQTLLSPKNY